MAKDALAQRLDAINMSTQQSDTYDRIRGSVGREIQQLKAVLDAAQLREKERCVHICDACVQIVNSFVLME